MAILPRTRSASEAAADLAEAFYALGELEFFHPHEDSEVRRRDVRERIDRARALGADEFPAFARELVREISACCRERDPGVTYRGFDGLDEVVGLDYGDDRTMAERDAGPERLYARAGAGVQTSYSTIFRLLDHLRLPEGAHLVDLGSGFGRVGLAAGLWRGDLRFSGYEYVGHRVEAARASAKRSGLDEARVRFLRQDLGEAGFRLPVAEVYYLYDPFSQETYRRVFAQIEKRGRERATMVVAKADARENFRRFVARDEWSEPEIVDEGTLMVFHSR